MWYTSFYERGASVRDGPFLFGIRGYMVGPYLLRHGLIVNEVPPQVGADLIREQYWVGLGCC